MLGNWCSEVGRSIGDIEISTELRDRTIDEADDLVDRGATLFTLGISGPEYDLAPAIDWLAWRDSKNA